MNEKLKKKNDLIIRLLNKKYKMDKTIKYLLKENKDIKDTLEHRERLVKFYRGDIK